MSLVAVGMVKDEADVIGHVIRHLASEGVDTIGILNNASSDATVEEIDKATLEVESAKPRRCRVRVVYDAEVGYYQSRKITAFAQFLAKPGDWVIPFDADELWHAPAGPLSEFFMGVEREVDVVDAGLLSHFATGLDELGDSVFERYVWRDPTVAPLPKLALRWEDGARVEQGAHGVTFTARPRRAAPCHLGASGLTVRHFPYRDPAQFVRKVRNGAAAYAATDLPHSTGQHWRDLGLLTDADLEALYATKYSHPWPLEAGQVRDPAPFCRWI